MSDISRELRKVADECLIGVANTRVSDLADRIDAEMAELPRGKDGRPIRIGETVFTNDDPGTSWCVRYIEMRLDREHSIGIESSGVNTYRPPSCLTHERPDSLERIADELDDMVDSADSADDGCEKLADLAERIRRLASKEASDGND